MSEALQALDIGKLTVSERLQLIDILWDSIPNHDEAFELTEEQGQELDRRVADCEANPEAGLTWEEVRDRLRVRRKSARS